MTQQSNDNICLVCAIDNLFVMPLAVMLKSALANLNRHKSVDIFVIDGGVETSNKAKISSSLSNVPIHWITPDTSLIHSLFISEHISSASYLRLLIPELLPGRYEKAIYLDADMVVMGDLNDLWSSPFEGTSLLACQDAYTPYVSSVGGLRNYKELELQETAKYFNAGVLVMNLKKWKTHKLTEKMLKYAKTNDKLMLRHDQEVMNVILANDWKELDLRWNQQPFFQNYKSFKNNPLSEKAYVDLMERPYIIHFATAKKPWLNVWFDGLGKDQFFYYLDQTAWAGWRPTVKESLWSRIQAKRKDNS